MSKTKAARQPLAAHFERLVVERCSKSKTILSLLFENFVSLSFQPATPRRSQIQQIAAAAQRPIPVLSLTMELSDDSVRGGTVFGNAADQIDNIVRHCENMWWWLTEDGLTVACLSGPFLSNFDQFAGKLLKERWAGNGLSKNGLSEIAVALDRQGFEVKDHLQPEWKAKVARHNQDKPKMAIKTFEALASHHTYSYGLRRRLYVARSRFNGNE